MKATDGLSPSYDPGMLTFSQAQGYEALPGPLKLEESAKCGEDTYLECVLFIHDTNITIS